MEPSSLTTGSLCSPTDSPCAVWDSVESPPPKKQRAHSPSLDSPALSLAIDLLFNEESAFPSASFLSLSEQNATVLEQQVAYAAFEDSIRKGDVETVQKALSASSDASEALRTHKLGYLHLALHSPNPQTADLLAQHISRTSGNSLFEPSERISRKGKERADLAHSLELLFETATEKNAYVTAQLLGNSGVNAKALSPLALANLGLVSKTAAFVHQAVKKGLPTDDAHPIHAYARAIHGRNANRTSRNKQTPLHIAATHGHTYVALSLLELGAKLTIVDPNKQTPFLLSCSHERNETALTLLTNGASVYETNCLRQNALHLACRALREDRVFLGELLKHYVRNIDAQDIYGVTPLHYACRHGYSEITAMLIARGASVTTRDKRGWNALMFACASGNVPLVSALLDTHGCILDIQDNIGNSPLDIACREGHRELFQEFHRRGALLNATGDMKYSWLLAACCSENSDLLTELIETFHCPVNWRKGIAPPALLIATVQGSVKVAKILIKHGAAVDYILKNGSTLLDRAGDNKELVMTLIAAGVLPPTNLRARDRVYSILEETLAADSACFYATLAQLPANIQEKWFEYLQQLCLTSSEALPSSASEVKIDEDTTTRSNI